MEELGSVVGRLDILRVDSAVNDVALRETEEILLQ